MRIAIDTAILVRASAKAGGPARRLLERIQESESRLVISPYILDEVRRVLNYPRLQAIYHLGEEDIKEHIRFLESIRGPLHCGQALLRSHVLSFCSRYRIRLMSDIELLDHLRQINPVS